MKIKRIVSALLATALTAILAVPAFAASSINGAEQRILDALDTEINGIRVLDTQTGKDFYADVKAILLIDGIDLDDVDANNVINNIWAAKDLLEENGITSYAELLADAALNAQVNALISDAMAKARIELSLDPDDPTVVIVQYEGNVVRRSSSSSSDSAVKQTGVDYTATWAVLALVVAATAGCAVFVKKNRVEI